MLLRAITGLPKKIQLPLNNHPTFIAFYQAFRASSSSVSIAIWALLC